MKKKLWQKYKNKLDPIVEAFETEGDLAMDQKLIPYDCIASLAHGKMLKKIGITSEKEFSQIEEGLLQIQNLYIKGKFLLKAGDEDMHTKIENYLTENFGNVGKKIHTGRSRNDQIATVLRLFGKEKLKAIEKELVLLEKQFDIFSKKYGPTKMPGYTHMQKAMPSTLGIWAGSFKKSLEEDLISVKTAEKINNQSPLGSGAGYGIPLKLNKEYTAKILNFENVLQNPLYCQNSRGKTEAIILASLISVLQTINKFSSDVLLFTTSEFGFFEVSDQVVTGSSIMPQKKNVDAAELLRTRVHVVLGNYVQIVGITGNLVSGYNRDFQDIKKPFIESVEVTLSSLKVAVILLKNLGVNKKNLESAMTEELFATHKALELVKKGMTFRDAYQKIKKGGEKNEK